VNIDLHIERLILDGVDISPGQRHLLQTSLEIELSRLLADGGLSPSLAGGVALPHVTVSGIQLAAGNDPAELGQQIAQSVYGVIGG